MHRSHCQTREGNGLYRYVGAHMHRRIFAGFAFAIFAAGLVVALLAKLSATGAWSEQEARLRTYVGQEFAVDWSDPTARLARAERVHKHLGLGVVLVDDRGARQTIGPQCKHTLDAPVLSGDKKLGDVRVCYPAPHLMGMRFVGAGVVVLVVLWMLAGKLARHITRPLAEVARVAEELAQGNLSARARLPHGVGEVRDVAAALNRMAERIDKQLTDQRALLAGVSHEIRTPLARMRFFIERLRGRSEVKTIDDIEREVLEMDELVGELLAGSRLDFGAPSRSTINVTEIAVAALERIEEPPEKLSVEGDNREVVGDPTLVRRALLNLLLNARRHGGGVEQLAITCTSERIRFEVLDTGGGFPKGEEERAFEPFVTAGTEGSVGLGLALVRRIAVAHGGRAFAENREHGGARVVFELPR